MPTTTQRLEVWKGLRKKTSGGLTKSMLTRNKRGKIVSKKKSDQAAAQNNLGSFLREAGKKVAASEMLRKKGSKKQPKAAPNHGNKDQRQDDGGAVSRQNPHREAVGNHGKAPWHGPRP